MKLWSILSFWFEVNMIVQLFCIRAWDLWQMVSNSHPHPRYRNVMRTYFFQVTSVNSYRTFSFLCNSTVQSLVSGRQGSTLKQSAAENNSVFSVFGNHPIRNGLRRLGRPRFDHCGCVSVDALQDVTKSTGMYCLLKPKLNFHVCHMYLCKQYRH